MINDLLYSLIPSQLIATSLMAFSFKITDHYSLRVVENIHFPFEQ